MSWRCISARTSSRLFSSAAIYYFVMHIVTFTMQEIYEGAYISQILSKLFRRSNNVRLARVKFEGGWWKYNVRTCFRTRELLGRQSAGGYITCSNNLVQLLHRSTRWTITFARELWTLPKTSLLSKRIVITWFAQNDMNFNAGQEILINLAS